MHIFVMLKAKKAGFAGFFFGRAALAGLEPVHKQVQAQPNNVNKVPIPGCTFKTKVVIGSEMPLHHAHKNHGQHRRAQQHMKAMKTGQHVKQRAIST
jgi:hypothetical protein